MPPHDCQDITTGRSRCVRPGSVRERKRSIWRERVPTEGHQTGETTEKRCRAPGGQIRPLALGFQADMSATFLDGGVQTPACQTITDHLLSRRCVIRGTQCLWRTRALRIAREHPAERHRIRARARPPRGGRTDLHGACAFAVPIHRDALPHRLWVMHDGLERWQTCSNHTRTTDGLRGACVGRVVDHCVHAKRSDQRHVLSDTMPSPFQETGGGLASPRDGHRGKPPTQQAPHRTCSHAHGRVPCSHRLADFRGRRQDTQKGQGPPRLPSRAA